MNLSAPTQLVFIISLVIGVLGLLSGLGIISALAGYGFWMVVVAWLALVAGSLLPGL